MRYMLAAFAALLASCVTAPQPPAQVLTPNELNTHSAQYDGADVVVRGFVVLGTNGRALYQSKERLDEFDHAFRSATSGFDPAPYYADCLTLLNAGILEANQSVFNGQTITVRGHFVRNYQTGDVLDLQACGGPTALALDERDVQRVLHTLRNHHQ